MPTASGRVQPNVSSVAVFTSTISPSWSTITTESSAARRIASLRASLAASARSERLRCVTSIIVAITPTTFPFASRIGAAEIIGVDQRAVAVQPAHVEVAHRLAGRDALERLEERRQLVLGDDRAHAADRLVGRPPEDLGRAAVPRADAAVEVEVDDRGRRRVDQRAVVLVGVLDLLELRRLLERGRRLVRERAQDLQALGVRAQAVDRVVGPDVADAVRRGVRAAGRTASGSATRTGRGRRAASCSPTAGPGSAARAAACGIT